MRSAIAAIMLTPSLVSGGVLSTLAHFETGTTKPTQSAGDFKRGRQGEISRWQVLPYVWKSYGGKYGDARYPERGYRIVMRLSYDLIGEFQKYTGRFPTPAEFYACYNSPTAMRKNNYDLSKMTKTVRGRAERFQNLYVKLNEKPTR